jgi:hypothetical protein
VDGQQSSPYLQLLSHAAAVNHKLTTEYDNITFPECQAHAEKYVAGVPVTGQISVMLYHFLFDSLTVEGLNKVNINKTPFTNNSNVGIFHMQVNTLAKALDLYR